MYGTRQETLEQFVMTTPLFFQMFRGVQRYSLCLWPGKYCKVRGRWFDSCWRLTFLFWMFSLFSVPHSSAKPIQMKSSMAFIRSNRWIEIDIIFYKWTTFYMTAHDSFKDPLVAHGVCVLQQVRILWTFGLVRPTNHQPTTTAIAHVGTLRVWDENRSSISPCAS